MSNLLLARSAQMGRHSLLPKEYQQVEYIESTGTQYINTEISGNHLTICLTSQLLDGGNDKSFFGTFNRQTNSGYFLTYYNSKWWYGTGDINQKSSTGVPKLSKQIVTYNDFDNKIWQNGELLGSLSTQNVETLSMFLFGRNIDNHTDTLCHCKIWNWTAYLKTNHIYVRNYVPCYRKSDGTAGMYDLCGSICSITGSSFYTNAGLGVFLLGPIVN